MPADNAPVADDHSASLFDRGVRIAHALASLVLGGLAMAIPLVAESAQTWLLGLILLASGTLGLLHAFRLRSETARRSAFWSGELSVFTGGLLLAAPVLVASGLAILLGASFVLDGLSRLAAAWKSRHRPEGAALGAYGLGNATLGLAIACQWPLSGPQAMGIYVGLRIITSGWTLLRSADEQSETLEAPAPSHPDRRLALAPHPALQGIAAKVHEEEDSRRAIDAYWQLTLLLVFFAIHAGRMSAEWTLVGMAAPFLAVLGDVVYSLVLALGIVTPIHLAWRWLTRPVERRAWARLFNQADRMATPGLTDRWMRVWLKSRLRFAVRVERAYVSPTAALWRGLQLGLPLTAVLIAVNPIWGLSWFFNTETWAAGVWEKWVEYRVDPWRKAMVDAARALPRAARGEDDPLEVIPPRLAATEDFSFLVVGDPGEGDASQLCLQDQYQALGQRADVKFLVVSSDVIYPAGAMKDYEANFYLPFKGFPRPIYAMPGNHDWYDCLEGFNANFLDAESARAAMRARVAADHKLTTTTEQRIETLLDEAARLRREYGVQTGSQRSSYFDIQGKRFALLVVDTGVLRTVDDDQWAWLRGALERSGGKFRMVILGHPLYVAGRYEGDRTEIFARIHQLLRQYRVELVMAGDTHDLEYYREEYVSDGQTHSMHHFVNGGGGAYLSIGTAMDFPQIPPVRDSAFYPRTDVLAAKLDAQTPWWKAPIWFWVKRLAAWPSSAEAMSAAFDFNRAPFFQSFFEVRVEGSANRVRLIPYGVHGPLRWRELQCTGHVVPTQAREDDVAEFVLPLPEPPK